MTKEKNNKKKKEEIALDDMTTLDTLMSIKVNSNLLRRFSAAVLDRGIGSNNSVVVREFMQEYIKKHEVLQRDVFKDK